MRGLAILALALLACGLAVPSAAQLPDGLPPCILSVLLMSPTQSAACQTAINYVTGLLGDAENSGETPTADDIDRDKLCKCAVLYSPSQLNSVDACLEKVVEAYSANLTQQQQDDINALNLSELKAGCDSST
jgi:hypothetical protein